MRILESIEIENGTVKLLNKKPPDEAASRMALS